MQRKATIVLAAVAVLMGTAAVGQIPVEVMAGHKRASFDLLFFKFFKNRQQQQSPWLFFNRHRATIDYKMTPGSNLPQFGTTAAISYNRPRLKGLAPVAVVQLLNRGVYPKLGIQYAKSAKRASLFTWAVVEALPRPNVDFFFLGRYTPPLGKKLQGFAQLELVNTLPSAAANNYSFVQRIRLGIKRHALQTGFGADFTAMGRGRFSHINNMGIFGRYEF
jgi:hypothetical protein